MFHRSVWECADAVFFFEKRLHFHYVDASDPNHCLKGGAHTMLPRPDNPQREWCTKCGVADCNAGGPSVLAAYGEQNAISLRESGLNGKYIELKPAGFKLSA